MSKDQELQHLLNSLIAVWPTEHTHPMVDRAREYLQTQHTSVHNADMLAADSEDYQTLLWYSI